VTSEKKPKSAEGEKGFAGLLSMVSDVETTVARAAKEKPGVSQETRSRGKPSETRATQEQAPASPEPDHPPAQRPGRSSLGAWLLVLAPIVGLIWFSWESENTAPRPASQQARGPESLQRQTQNRPTESKPPVGTSNALSAAQIRYCLAEDIRLEAARPFVDSYTNSDVDRFDAMVSDYNSRCGEFRYRSSALASARSDVESYRSLLQTEGRNRFLRAPSVPAQQALPRRQPDATVQVAQQRLNDLGYDAGGADGLSGPKTIAAIKAFQADQNLPVDGILTTALLARLGVGAPRSTSTFEQQYEELFGEAPKNKPVGESRPSERNVSR
jgi:Putative peptidoglycan binding domain